MSERRPRLSEVINAAIESALRELPRLMPAKIVKWDAAKQRADCQILIKHITRDEDDARVATSWPVIPGVPVQFLGAGGFRITCPISDGTSSAATTGSLVFAMRSMDKWLTGSGAEVDPEFDHDQGLTDAVFYPGLMPFGSPWQSCPTDEMTIGADTGVQMHFQSGVIIAGDTAGADNVALAAKVKAWFDAFNTAVSGWVVVPNDGGGALKTALSTLSGGTPTTDVASTQFKAK
jgi:hypothetical protein